MTLNNLERLNNCRLAISMVPYIFMWPAQFGRKLVMGTRLKWPRQRQDRDVDNIFVETGRRYVSRPSRDRDDKFDQNTSN